MGNNAMTQALGFCCHVERLPRQQLSVTSAPVSGPRPGVQNPEVYGQTYDELLQGSELDQTTWVHSTGIRTMDVKNIYTGLVYSCLRLRKKEAPVQDQDIIDSHIKALCGVSHPHLCKMVESFDLLEERLLICEKPTDEIFFDSAIGQPWRHVSPGEKEQSKSSVDPSDATQLRKDERIIAELLRQLISALAHGHSRGFVHGILTPDKVRIHEGFRKSQTLWGPPQVKVIGFGLGHVLLPTPGQNLHKELKLGADTRTFAMLPGLPYSAPETFFPTPAAYKKHMEEVQLHNAGLFEGKVMGGNPGRNTHGKQKAQEAESEDEDDGGKKKGMLVLPKDLHLIDSDKKGVSNTTGADKADIWSVGALAYRLLTGVPPFHHDVLNKKSHKQEHTKLLEMLQNEPVLFQKKDWDVRSSKCFDAVRWMLRLHPNLRPSAVDLLRHPWLKLERESVPYPRMHRLFANSLNFLKESQFKKLVIRVISEQMPDSGVHVKQAAAVFRALDKDRDALLSPEEFMEGLRRMPDLVERLGEDPGRLFEAADRDGSGFLDLREFAACTMPPSKARNEQVIWYVFRAFDEEGDKVVTIDKVLYIARILEGRLNSWEQMDELLTVLQAELQKIRVPMRLTELPPENTQEEEASDESEEIIAEGEFDDEEGDDETTHSSKRSSVATGDKSDTTMSFSASKGSKEATATSFSISESRKESKESGTDRKASKGKKGKKKKKEVPTWIQRKIQGMIEKSRKWATKPRPLDFGEFAYLCDTRRKLMGPRLLIFKAARKEAYRIAAKYDWDFYEVVHKVSDLLWPPEAGTAATNPKSCYFVTGGITSSRQQTLRAEAKDKKDGGGKPDDDDHDDDDDVEEPDEDIEDED